MFFPTSERIENLNKRPKTLLFYAKHIPNRVGVGAGLGSEVSLWDPARTLAKRGIVSAQKSSVDFSLPIGNLFPGQSVARAPGVVL